MRCRRLWCFLIPLLLLAVLWPVLPTNLAQAAPPDSSVQISHDANGTRLTWQANDQVRLQADTLPDLPLIDIGGQQLPAQLVPLQITNAARLSATADILTDTLALAQVDSVPWQGALPTATPPIIPRTLAGDLRPDLAPSPPAASLPDGPLVVVRTGWQRGVQVAVVALSPLFAGPDGPRLATNVDAALPGTAPLAHADLARSAMALAAAPGPLLASAPGPTNPLAGAPAWKIHVAAGGMQRISGADLAAAGADLAALDPTRLALWHDGLPVALELRSATAGRLGASDELRFYAPAPGDRWNLTDTYWLTLSDTPGPRMSSLPAAAASAAPQDTAHTGGAWAAPAVYDSHLSGPDSDHWFTADMRAGGGQASAPVTAVLTPTVPLVVGTLTLTLTGSAYTDGPHTLAVTFGSSRATVRWQGVGDWEQPVALRLSAPRSTPLQVQIRAEAGAAVSGVLLDGLTWDAPARLSVSADEARFRVPAGDTRYQLAGLAADSALYDVSTPRAPVRTLLTPGNSAELAVPESSRAYVLVNDNGLHTPALTASAPDALGALTSLSGADVIYLAPGDWHAALAPLLAHRRAQGYTAALVDVQTAYDAWSFGQTDPAAIRALLRWTLAHWQPAPQAVVLVGDGSADPHRFATQDANVNIIPPYLAPIDPWLNETACDTCYVRLDGDDPLADPLPDMALGRLPAKTTSELAALVAKLLAYETSSDAGLWRSRAVYVTDNFREATGSVDTAGNFHAMADASIAELPRGMRPHRVYYDPYAETAATAPWREPDAQAAHARTRAAFEAGASLVTFFGHGHAWQWALTDPQAEPSHLLGLFDADDLTNTARLPVVLSMTCLTSSFHQPARSGTTIDERLLLAPGGAAAVWGPTGLGVAYGHDALHEGFLTVLNETTTSAPTLGALTQAGYSELFLHGICCQEALRTFVLLGDPLTPLRVSAASERIYLPTVQR